MPNDFAGNAGNTGNSGAGAGQGSGGNASTMTNNLSSPTPNLNPSPSPGINPTIAGQGQGQGQNTNTNTLSNPNPAANNPLLPPGANANVPPITPPATPEAFNVAKYGGEQRIDAGLKFYEQFAGNQFNPNQLLQTMAQLSPERYQGVARSLLNSYLPAIQENLLANISQDEDLKMAALQSIGWSPQEYQEFMNYKASGQTERLNPPDPRYQQLETKVQALEREKEEAAFAQQQAAYQNEYAEFRSDYTKPAMDLIEKLNLPQTPQGQLWKSIILGGIEELFSKDPEAFELANNAFNGFMSGQGGLVKNNHSFTLRAAVQKHAEQVTKEFQSTLWKASEYDRLQMQNAPRKDPLAGGQGAMTNNYQANNNNNSFNPNQYQNQGQYQQPQQQAQAPVDNPFDPDYIRMMVNRKLGIAN